MNLGEIFDPTLYSESYFRFFARNLEYKEAFVRFICD